MKLRQAIFFVSIIFFILFTSIPAFASDDEKVIKIDPTNVIGVFNMRSEITSMIEDLDYSWYPILNESTGQKIKVAEKYGQWRMLFKHDKDESIQIRLHIRQTDNMTGLHFTEVGSDKLSDQAMQYYHVLKKRIIRVYGEDNMSESYTFFTP
jgi:hypothetical protein